MHIKILLQIKLDITNELNLTATLALRYYKQEQIVTNYYTRNHLTQPFDLYYHSNETMKLTPIVMETPSLTYLHLCWKK